MKAGFLLLERLAAWTFIAGLMARIEAPLADAWAYLCVTTYLAALFVIGFLFVELLGRAIDWALQQWFHVK